jgi:hypothetical protein
MPILSAHAQAGAGPQEIICENRDCQRSFVPRPRNDGRATRFCCRPCWIAWQRGHGDRDWQRRSGNYWTIHVRVRDVRGPAKNRLCATCGGKARDWALRHGLSGKDPADFTPLCKKCHIAYDQSAIGVSRPGEQNPAAKLTWGKVREIRALRGQVPARELALRYGVSRSNISMIMIGKTWVEHVQLFHCCLSLKIHHDEGWQTRSVPRSGCFQSTSGWS